MQNDALNLVSQKVDWDFGGELAGFAYGRTMIAAEDQYGNYQSTLTDNGIYAPVGSGVIVTYAGNYGGNQPPFSPTAFAALAVDTSTNQEWLWFNGAWTEVSSGGSGSPDSISYVGPPLLNPPSLQNIVVDSQGRVWVYFNGDWN